MQVVIPLSAAKTFQLDKGSFTPGFDIKVYAHGYLLPGTTAATIQTGTAALPTIDGISNGSVITHGLGFTPPHVRVVLRCLDATNAQGYAAGVELDLSDIGTNTNNYWPAFHVSINETEIRIFRATDGINPSLTLAAGNGNPSTLQTAKWQLKAYWARVDGVIPNLDLQGSFLTRASFEFSAAWVCPAGVTKARVIVIGGGAGGLGSPANDTSGGGGGSGGFSVSIIDVIPGTSYPFIVGVGGAGATLYSGGQVRQSSQPGSPSSFGSNSIVANGGLVPTGNSGGAGAPLGVGMLTRLGNVGGNGLYYYLGGYGAPSPYEGIGGQPGVNGHNPAVGPYQGPGGSGNRAGGSAPSTSFGSGGGGSGRNINNPGSGGRGAIVIQY